MVCFAEHAHACTVARFSPDSSAVASGDSSGVVRVWDANTRKTRSGPLAALGGPVSDVAFSSDAKTVYVCGAAQGRGRLAGAFDVERGVLLGALSGLTRNANSLDVTRDGSRVWTGDDAGTLFAHDASGLNSRPSRSDQGGRSINSVRCSPSNGVTAAAGGQALLLYGGDGVPPVSLAGHGGSIYCAEWSLDGQQLLSSGADKTVRLWDATSAREVARFSAGSAIEDMQVGCAWLHDCGALASLSLSGDILLFDPRLAGCHTRILGHQRAVSTACAAGGEVWTGDLGGRILRWPADGCAVRLSGHKNAVMGAALCSGKLVTAGLDDVASWAPLAAGTAASVSLPGAPASVGASAEGLVAIVCTKGIQIARNACLLSLTPVPGAACAAISQDGRDVAVGCEDGSLHLFITAAEKLVTACVLNKHRGAVTAVAFDAAGVRIASCDANREVVVWDRQPACPGWIAKVSLGSMVYHAARVTSLAWASDGGQLASGSLDGNIILWDMQKPSSARVTLSNAHREGVTALAWSGDLVSCGADACVRFWATK